MRDNKKQEGVAGSSITDDLAVPFFIAGILNQHIIMISSMKIQAVNVPPTT